MGEERAGGRPHTKRLENRFAVPEGQFGGRIPAPGSSGLQNPNPEQTGGQENPPFTVGGRSGKDEKKLVAGGPAPLEPFGKHTLAGGVVRWIHGQDHSGTGTLGERTQRRAVGQLPSGRAGIRGRGTCREERQ